MRKTGLLFIGELAKITGASVKSLRYYEQLGILLPAYIDPGTNYRYYAFNQIYLVDVILICIEMDIKLKRLTDFIEDGIIDYDRLLAFGEKIAEEKLIAVTKGLHALSI